MSDDPKSDADAEPYFVGSIGPFFPISTTVVHGPIEDVPLFKHRRLYWLMLHPWFPWRLRKWIERRVLSRIPTRLRVETIRHQPPPNWPVF